MKETINVIKKYYFKCFDYKSMAGQYEFWLCVSFGLLLNNLIYKSITYFECPTILTHFIVLILNIPLITLCTRRLNDIEQNIALSLLALVPGIVSLMFFLFLMLKKGKTRENYGIIYTYITHIVIILLIVERIINAMLSIGPLPDYISEYLKEENTNGYYYNISAKEFNNEYKYLIDNCWSYIYIPSYIPGDKYSYNFNVTKDVIWVDYGTFSNMRTIFYQNRAGEKIDNVSVMNHCQENEIAVKRSISEEEKNIQLGNKNLIIEYLDFYNKETNEYIKTVIIGRWTENEFSFYVETDCDINELDMFLNNIEIIVIEQNKSLQ